MIAVTWSSRARISACASTPLMFEFDLAELDVDPDAQLDQVENLGVQRDPRHQVVELEVDLVDLDDGNVDDDIGLVGVADFDRIDERVVLVHLLRHGFVRALVADLALPLAAFDLPVLSSRVGLLLRPLPSELCRAGLRLLLSDDFDFDRLRSLFRLVCWAIALHLSPLGSLPLRNLFPLRSAANALAPGNQRSWRRPPEMNRQARPTT